MWVSQHATCPECGTESSIVSDGRLAAVTAHHALWPVSSMGQSVGVTEDGLLLTAECPVEVHEGEVCNGRLTFDLDGAQSSKPSEDATPIEYPCRVCGSELVDGVCAEEPS